MGPVCVFFFWYLVLFNTIGYILKIKTSIWCEKYLNRQYIITNDVPILYKYYNGHFYVSRITPIFIIDYSYFTYIITLCMY